MSAWLRRRGGQGFEVLMVQRSRAMKFATAQWVFPGEALGRWPMVGGRDSLI